MPRRVDSAVSTCLCKRFCIDVPLIISPEIVAGREAFLIARRYGRVFRIDLTYQGKARLASCPLVWFLQLNLDRLLLLLALRVGVLAFFASILGELLGSG